MPDTTTTARFLDEIAALLKTMREESGRALERFFMDLAPRLETARALERDLDRFLARRFNVLDYLRQDELGLSKILADLLDPDAAHGQGWLFLGAFLKLLGRPVTDNRFEQIDEDNAKVVVALERVIDHGRRIDISVEIESDGERYCLAVENKPYAGDQERQVADYLSFLEGAYKDRFMLIYLSSTGQPPSEASVSRQALEQDWKGRFAIWSYYDSGEVPDDDLVRLHESLRDWIADCRRDCEVDRLRSFLRDIETFCERTMGGKTMLGDGEREAVLNYVLADPERLETALAVHESWPDIRDRVCEDFMRHLYEKIKSDDRLPGSLTVNFQYDGETRKGNRLWLCREVWKSHPNADKSNNPDSGHRYEVRLESWGPGPQGWYIGVLDPTKGNDRERFAPLKAQLGGRSEAEWPWWEDLDGKIKNWTPLVPDLLKECNDGDGKIMNTIADRFVDVASAAIPVIDDIEGATK